VKITFLGTGTSHGVPSIDCMLSGYTRCKKDVCRLSLNDPKHRRTRSSVLIEYRGKHVLIDVSADFRQQALTNCIQKIDAVLITHKHSDHINGIPDIRSYTHSGQPLPLFGSAESMEAVRRTFDYIFSDKTFVGGGIPRLALTAIDRPFALFNETVTPLPVTHGNLTGCLGYRIGNTAYIPDMKSIDDRTKNLLRNLDCLILNCLRDEREHSTHMILDQSVRLARELAPARCCFIHMCHDIHYELDAQQLDEWMEFSYDGMKIEI
jgi:phosphoribosyl 1,2-cyclic phosphate phosphodiesterase